MKMMLASVALVFVSVDVTAVEFESFENVGNYNSNTGLVVFPAVAVGDTTFYVEMQHLGNLEFKVSHASPYPGMLPDLAIAGSYEGEKKGSTTGCEPSFFAVSPSDTTIMTDGNEIFIGQDDYFDGVCEFTGTYEQVSADRLSASGTFQCSNFDEDSWEGNWSSSTIRKTSDSSFYAKLDVSVSSRECDYSVEYIGVR